MSISSKLNHLLVVSACVLLASCGGGSSSGTGPSSTNLTPIAGNALFNLAITDGPVDSAQQVVVQLNGVRIKPADGDEIVFDFDTPLSIDLLTLQGSISSELLDGENLPAGDYNWIRLAVSAEYDGIYDSYIIMDDGTQLEIRVPSGSNNGLRLVSGFTVNAGDIYNFTIDFDLRKSITNPPGQPGVIMKPTLRLVDEVDVGALTGSIDPTLLSNACENVTENDGAVYLYEGEISEAVDIQGNGNDPLTTALVKNDYNYEIGFIPAGTYSVAYTCDNENDDPEQDDMANMEFLGLTVLSIEAGQETIVNFE